MGKGQIGYVTLVWLREGEWGDTELVSVNATERGAKDWCNYHRKIRGADPIQWKLSEDGPIVLTGTSGIPQRLRKETGWSPPLKYAALEHGVYHYILEEKPLGE